MPMMIKCAIACVWENVVIMLHELWFIIVRQIYEKSRNKWLREGMSVVVILQIRSFCVFKTCFL